MKIDMIVSQEKEMVKAHEQRQMRNEMTTGAGLDLDLDLSLTIYFWLFSNPSLLIGKCLIMPTYNKQHRESSLFKIISKQILIRDEN